MTKTVRSYVRMESDGVAVYVYPEGPDWFVPTPSADALLRRAVAGAEQGWRSEASSCGQDGLRRLAERIVPASPGPYRGRGGARELAGLKECWFHITNRCDMACTHCMFASGGPGACDEIPPAHLRTAIQQAFDLGSRVFFFTGGEPLVYPGFTGICDDVLARPDTHVVILTNAKSAPRFESWFASAPRGRVHVQVSIDGDRVNHDRVRGDGAYERLMESLALFRATGVPVTLSMSVTKDNVTDMRMVAALAGELGIGGVHFMWLFGRGRAGADDIVDVDTITQELFAAYRVARDRGVSIDNVEAVRSQLFTVPGTRFDLSNSAWESLAVGPEGGIYPSPALVGIPELRGGTVEDGVGEVWRNSEVFRRVRTASVIDSPATAEHPLRFLLGGGDVDHSYHACGTFVGGDPYMDLYAGIALFLIAEHARSHRCDGSLGLRCRMGEYLVECGPESGPVMFTHSNCVQSVSGHDSHGLVRSFYSRAAETTNEEILNPVTYGEENVAHIPEHMRVRSYGCGSPVLDCDLQSGQTLADLGSGTGIECFVASKLVGPTGAVYGVDMSEAMLRRAEEARQQVVAALGYDNVAFRSGLLEHLPLDSESVDFVISNCVINLSPDKRRVFEEIYRVLKPGGELCISDIVTMSDIPVEMKYNEKLRGECLGGAMLQGELFCMMEEVGFARLYLVRKYEYRRVNGRPFYSITYRAARPRLQTTKTVIYRGPHASVTTDAGETFLRGRMAEATVDSGDVRAEEFFVLDQAGNVANVEQQTACGVFVAPGADTAGGHAPARHARDCVVCGAPLTYDGVNQRRACHYCHREVQANASCENGHFVCDDCHSRDARELMLELCDASTETDPVALFMRVRAQAGMPAHGPEYHSLVPAVIVAACRNAGMELSHGAITTAVERGATIAGGSCGFIGACGAALGVGTALSIVLGGTPFEPTIRRTVQTVTADILGRIAGYSAARCCQRDCLIAISRFAELSHRYLPQPLRAEPPEPCTQYRDSEHCIGSRCPWRTGRSPEAHGAVGWRGSDGRTRQTVQSGAVKRRA